MPFCGRLRNPRPLNTAQLFSVDTLGSFDAAADSALQPSHDLLASSDLQFQDLVSASAVCAYGDGSNTLMT